MSKSYEDMTHREAREHLASGGYFVYESTPNEAYMARAVVGEPGVYVLVFRGEDNTVEAQVMFSLTHLANAMETQVDLSEWRAKGVEDENSA